MSPGWSCKRLPRFIFLLRRHLLLGYTCNNSPTKLNLFIKESYISYKLPTVTINFDKSIKSNLFFLGHWLMSKPPSYTRKVQRKPKLNKLYLYWMTVAVLIDKINSPYRLIFVLNKSRPKNYIPEKNLSKVVKSRNLVEIPKFVNNLRYWKIVNNLKTGIGIFDIVSCL